MVLASCGRGGDPAGPGDEECFAWDECDAYAAFIAAGKPVLVAEYAASEAAARTVAARICPEAARRGFAAVVYPLELDGTWEVPCD